MKLMPLAAVPSFMRPYMNKGLEPFAIEDYDWDLDETEPQLEMLKASLSKNEPLTGTAGHARDGQPPACQVAGLEPLGKKRRGRPERDDLDVLLLIANEALDDFVGPQRRRRSWARMVEDVVASMPAWATLNESQRETELRRIRGKFLELGVPLFEIMRRQRLANNHGSSAV